MAILTLRPNGAGALTQIPAQVPDSGAHWDKVDEESPDDGSTYVITTGPTFSTVFTDLYTTPGHTTEKGVINSVTVYHRSTNLTATGAGHAAPRLRTYSVVYGPSLAALTASWANYNQAWNTNPNTTDPWTWDEVDALQIGVAHQAEFETWNARTTQVYAEVDYTPPPDPPTDVSATKGAHLDKVIVTWEKSTGATGYRVYRDSVDVSGLLGDVATYDDTGAGATITPGATVASVGEFDDKIGLSLDGASIDGTVHTYVVTAVGAGGESDDSDSDTGYREAGELSYQWQVSAAASDGDYSDIDGATAASHDYVPPPDVSGIDISAGKFKDFVRLEGNPTDSYQRYYRCLLDSTGYAQQISAPALGFKMESTWRFQWKRSAADTDNDYSDIDGAVFYRHDDRSAPDYPAGRYYQYVATSDETALSDTSAGTRGYRRAPLAPDHSVGLLVKDPDGNTLHVLRDFSGVNYDRRVNEIGTLGFTLPSDSPARDDLYSPNEIWLYRDGKLKDLFKITDVRRSR